MYQINYNNQLFSISKSLAVFIQKEFPKVSFETKDNTTIFSVDSTFFSSIECVPNSSPRHFYVIFPFISIKKFRVRSDLFFSIVNTQNTNVVKCIDGVDKSLKLKNQLGQFFTKNADYIMQGLLIPEKSVIIEPFAGDGDLVEWSKRFLPTKIESFDISPKKN